MRPVQYVMSLFVYNTRLGYRGMLTQQANAVRTKNIPNVKIEAIRTDWAD